MNKALKKVFSYLVFIICFSLLLFYLVFYKHISFYKPLALSIESEQKLSPENISVFGITRFGNIYNFSYNHTTLKWGMGYAFIKNITLEIDTSYIDSSFRLELTSGNNIFVYNKHSFLENWEKKSNNNKIFTFTLKKTVEDKNFFLAIFSVFRWQLTQKIFGLFAIVVCIFFLIYLVRHKSVVKYLYQKKFVIILLLLYGFSVFLIFKELLRYKNYNLEGISMQNALVFLLFISLFLLSLIEIISFLLHVKKDSLFNIRTLYVALFFSLFCGEFILRMFSVYSTHTERIFNKYSNAAFIPPDNHYMITQNNKNSTVIKKEFVFSRTFNSEGLPDIEHKQEKDSGTYRIMAFGDSFTEGVGADADSTWLKFLSYKLNACYSSVKFEYFNAGISGSDPFFAYKLLNDRMLKYQPDLVLLCINTTDISDYFIRGGFERFCDDGTVAYKNPPHWEWLYAYSYIARLVVHNVLGYDTHFLNKNEQRIALNDALTALKDVTEKFQDGSTSNNFKLVLILHPQLFELLKGKYLYEKFEDNFKQINKINILDVLAYFKSKGINTPEKVLNLYWEIDQHHNASGYELFGQAVYEYLTNNILNTQ